MSFVEKPENAGLSLSIGSPPSGQRTSASQTLQVARIHRSCRRRPIPYGSAPSPAGVVEGRLAAGGASAAGTEVVATGSDSSGSKRWRTVRHEWKMIEMIGTTITIPRSPPIQPHAGHALTTNEA